MRFNVESWVWYSFAIGMIVVRLVSRTLLFGSPLRLQYDDWIMGIFVAATYTVLIVMANIEAKAQSNLLQPGFDAHMFTAQEIVDREYGSKVVIVVEQMQIAVIWACKACLLILYHRLTQSVAANSNIAIKLLAVYVALGFVVMEILYFAAWCRPFDQYWAVPTKSPQCNALINHRITNAVFNLSSDLIMLGIALPIFVRSMLPWKRKLILCCIFSLGIFVILAAVLNKYYSFKKPYEPTWIFWYVRESSTAVLVANLPFTWTLLRKIFNLGAFDEEHPPPPTYHSSRSAGGRRTARAHHTHGTTVPNEKHAESYGAASRRSLSLIGSFCAPKDKRSPANGSENSRYSGNALLEEAIQPRDFSANIDLERGLSGPDSSPIDFYTALRSTSPTSRTNRDRTSAEVPTASRQNRGRLSADGTGGYIRHPHHTHLSATFHPSSRASSIASTARRSKAMNPTPTLSNHDEAASAEPASADGGRSVTDRKKRVSATSSSRAASIMSVSTNGVEIPTITAPTHRSPDAGSTSQPAGTINTRVGGGGGRSAADRSKRVKMSGWH